MLKLLIIVSYIISVQSILEPDQFSHLKEMAAFEKEKMQASLYNMHKLVDQFTSLMSMFSNDEEHQKKVWMKHEKNGVFKSMEGSALEIKQKRLELQER